MNKLGAMIGVSGLIMLVAVGCSTSAASEDESILERIGVTVGMTEQQVIDTLGQPSLRSSSTYGEDETVNLIYPGITAGKRLVVVLENGVVTEATE